VDLAVPYPEPASSEIGDADSQARVFHRARYAGFRVFIVFIFDREQHLFKRRSIVRYLAIGKFFPRSDRIFEPELPRRKTDFLCEKVNVALRSKAALGDSEPSERARRRIVGVDCRSLDVDVVVVIRARRVRAGPLKDRAAQ